MGQPKVYEYLHDWYAWSFPAVFQLFAPWQDKLSGMRLISEWFQPELNVGASMLGALACLFVFGLLNSAAHRKIRAFLVVSFVVFLALLIVNIGIKYSLGVIFHPSPANQILVWIFWAASYLAMFVSLGVTLIASILAARDMNKERKDQTPNYRQ